MEILDKISSRRGIHWRISFADHYAAVSVIKNKQLLFNEILA
jgi:hypothetical protein